MSDVSDDNASVRDAEAYVNRDCHEESETSRALLVESKQPGTSVNIFESLQESQPVNQNRKSQGNVVNNYGKLLLNLRTTFDLCILNGVCEGDLQGCYTYISETGSSVNDYFVK